MLQPWVMLALQLVFTQRHMHTHVQETVTFLMSSLANNSLDLAEVMNLCLDYTRMQVRTHKVKCYSIQKEYPAQSELRLLHAYRV